MVAGEFNMALRNNEMLPKHAFVIAQFIRDLHRLADIRACQLVFPRLHNRCHMHAVGHANVELHPLVLSYVSRRQIRTINVACPSSRTCPRNGRWEETKYELKSLMRISYAVFCLHKQ